MLPTFLNANGLEFALLQARPAGVKNPPLMLMLHGFPDSAWSFAPILPQLADAGWHAVAPFMRGYLPTAIPADGDYRLSTLACDVIALIDHLGAQKAVVVGHDWGAVAGYAAAAMRPDRVRALVAAAIPHLRRFLLRPSGAQLLRSRYMLKFQQRGIEAGLRADDCAALKALAQSWSPGLDVGNALAPVWAGFGQPGRLEAALGYYRALPALLGGAALPLALAPTTVPTLVLHGAQDGCIGPEMFAGQSHLFAGRFEQQCLENAGHFVQLEQPQAFAAAVLGFSIQGAAG